MFKNLFTITIVFLYLLVILVPKTFAKDSQIWEVKSIDTMKYSRDRANLPFDNINYVQQLTLIKSLGANYVAIDTPYDEKFYPYLKAWVDRAHSLGLHVWFRGNWSSWEGWFNFPKNLDRNGHLIKTKNFILDHSELFQDGDSFTPCPECEYGGLGNPLSTGDYKGYRKFMLDEYSEVNQSFAKINKKIITNWLSMNPDVAKKALDTETVQKIGNVITLDSYFRNTTEVQNEINYFSSKFPKAKIFMGEFGAPLPDLNGNLNEDGQAVFINTVYDQFFKSRDKIIGVNYWVSNGGQTAILNDDNTLKKAAITIKNYYVPFTFSGNVKNSLGENLSSVDINTTNGISLKTDDFGSFQFATPDKNIQLTARKQGFIMVSSSQSSGSASVKKSFILKPINPGIIYKLRLFIKNITKS